MKSSARGTVVIAGVLLAVLFGGIVAVAFATTSQPTQSPKTHHVSGGIEEQTPIQKFLAMIGFGNYNVKLRIGTLPSCSYSGNYPLVYPRSGGYLDNDDIIEMIDYCTNPSGLGFRECRSWIEIKEMESGAVSIYADCLDEGFNPHWTYSYYCWYSDPCCSQSGDTHAWWLAKNAKIEVRIWRGSPVNMYSPPVALTIGNPNKRAQFDTIYTYWTNPDHLVVEYGGNNLEPSGGVYNYRVLASYGGVVRRVCPSISANNPTNKVIITNPPDGNITLHLRWQNFYPDMVEITIPPFVCEESTKECQGYNHYECQSNQWVLIEENSINCGYTAPICTPPNRRCSGNNVEQCNADGSAWVYVQTCTFGCLKGVCTFCPPNEVRCINDVLERCDNDGDAWVYVGSCNCDDPTEHFSSNCALLLHYDNNNDGEIDRQETTFVVNEYFKGIVTYQETIFVGYVFQSHRPINEICLGCYSPVPTPTPTPPGFGALPAIVGVVVASCFFILRREKKEK